MANPFFQFKKFIVHQQHTSMKVCTDACLFGAWVAQKELTSKSTTILDIGTGTGLLSLMLAQVTEQSKAKISAVEIEQHAASEASSNFNLSPWKDRIRVFNDSIQNFTKGIITSNEQVDKTFDLIITNPPFFEGDLKSPDINKNKAAHSTELPWSVLIENVSNLLSDTGSFFVLVPTLRAYTMQKLAESNQMYLAEEVLVYNDAKHLPFRAMLQFKKTKENVVRNKIVIKEGENNYSSAFTNLLAAYYLYL